MISTFYRSIWVFSQINTNNCRVLLAQLFIKTFPETKDLVCGKISLQGYLNTLYFGQKNGCCRSLRLQNNPGLKDASGKKLVGGQDTCKGDIELSIPPPP